MEGFAEEGVPNWVATGWTEKATEGLDADLLYWDRYILPSWPKLTQRQVAVAELGTPRCGRERLMIVQSHFWPPVACRCKTALICSLGCCLGSSHGSEALLQWNVKQRRRFSRVVIMQSQKDISDIQPSFTGHLLKTQPWFTTANVSHIFLPAAPPKFGKFGLQFIRPWSPNSGWGGGHWASGLLLLMRMN